MQTDIMSSSDLTVLTPEHARLTFRTAGTGSRAGAHALDLAVLAGSFLVIAAILSEILFRGQQWLNWNFSGMATAGIIIGVMVVQLGYFVVCECYMGRTLGGRVVGLRVIQENGQPVTLLSSIIRNLLRVIDFLPSFYVTGFLVSFFHPKGKRLGDLLAGTVVIYDQSVIKPKKKKALFKMGPGWSGGNLVLEDYQIRRITREEWLMLDTMVERMEELTPVKLRYMGAEMARYFLRRLELPEETANQFNSSAFLLALHEILRGHWQIEI